MKNNKAFTLVELIVIIVILGVIMVFALPNITSTLERNKKDKMIIDAKDMVEKARNYISAGNSYSNGDKLDLSTIDVRGEIKDSPFGNSYKTSTSYVIRQLEDNMYKYQVCLTDGVYALKVVGTEGGKQKDISVLSSDNKYTYIAPGTC